MQRSKGNAANTPRPLLSRKQVSIWLGVSVSALKAWAERPDLNGLPFLKDPGIRGAVRYRFEDVERWIDVRMVRPRAA